MNGRQNVSLFAIIAISALARFYELGRASFWLDELFSRRVAMVDTLGGAIRAGSVDDMFPPLYPALTYFAVRGPGSAEFALRLPSAIAGVLATWLMFVLGRALFSSRVGLIAASLCCFHWFAVAYSQEGRPYALLLVVSVLVALSGLHVMRCARDGADTRGAWLAYGAAGLLASYLHYIGLLFFALSGPLMVIALRRHALELRRATITVAVCAFAYLPWIGVVLAQIDRRTHDKVPPPVAQLFLATHDLCARYPLPCLAVLALGLWASRGRPLSSAGDPATARRRALTVAERGWLLAIWLIVPPIGMWILSYAVVPIFTKRNTIVALPALLLLAASALDAIDRRWLRNMPLASAAWLPWSGQQMTLAHVERVTETSLPRPEPEPAGPEP